MALLYCFYGCAYRPAPTGPTGARGATGPTGPAPTFSIGTVTTLRPGANPTVTLTGNSTTGYVLNFGLPTTEDD